MRKLKIVFLSCGSLRKNELHLKYFTSRGHDVKWITFTKNDDNYGFENVSIGETVIENQPDYKKIAYFFILPKLRKLLKKWQPDILHAHYVTSGGILCYLSGFRPYVLSALGSDLIDTHKSRIWRPILKKVLKKAGGVRSVANNLTNISIDLGADPENILTSCEGVDTELFSFHDHTELHDPLKLICTRSLRPVYNNEVIIKACKILKERNVNFEMYFPGEGALLNDLKSMAESLVPGVKFTFTDGFKNTDLPDILKEQDLYISASLWDGTSVCLLEAQAAGLFPIVSRIESNHAWIKDGQTGLMFDCDNPAELADAVQKAVADRELRTRATRYNRDLVEREADREHNMEKLEEFYYKIIGG